MAVKFLIGNKKIFLDFLNSISEKDNVAILTHNDLDGIASAIFLEEILNKKEIKPKLIEFLTYKEGMFEEHFKKLEKNKISHIFISDIGADQTDLKGFEELRKKFNCLLIDHHPIDNNLKDKKNIIKTESGDCAALVIYELGENIFNRKKWEFLVCSAIITDIAYKKTETLEFVKKIYPEVTIENIENSKIGELSKTISSSLFYFKKNLRKAYDLIKENNLSQLKKYRLIIDKEIDKQIKNFEKNAEFYPKKKIYFHTFKPKFDISSIISTKISLKITDRTIIIFNEKKDGIIRASARNQNKLANMNELMKKGIKGLENAVGGGHVAAAGASFMKKDLEKFKQNILNS